jgi:hypothetical protein
MPDINPSELGRGNTTPQPNLSEMPDILGNLKGLFTSGQGRTSENTQGSLRNDETRVPSALRSYVGSFISPSTIRDEDYYSDPEVKRLTDIAVDKIRRGRTGVSYSDYDKIGGRDIGYGMPAFDLNDINSNLKYSIGKGDFVRDGEDAVLADEYDFDSPTGINNKPFLDRLKFMAGRTGDFLTRADSNNDGRVDMSAYGLAHSLGEAFGPNAGEGPSTRINLGTAIDLGLTPEQFASLPTLQSYTDANRNRIRPRGDAQYKYSGGPVNFGNMNFNPFDPNFDWDAFLNPEEEVEEVEEVIEEEPEVQYESVKQYETKPTGFRYQEGKTPFEMVDQEVVPPVEEPIMTADLLSMIKPETNIVDTPPPNPTTGYTPQTPYTTYQSGQVVFGNQNSPLSRVDARRFR